MSQSTAERLSNLKPAALQPLVRQVLGDTAIDIKEWRCEPIYGGFGQGANNSHRLYRWRGTAAVRAGLRPWSMILKILNDTDGSGEPGSSDYWKREALLYQSGLLNAVAPALVAPACYGVADQSDVETWIWMEDVREYTDGGAAGTWPQTHFALAAERLGLFNGAYLIGQPIPQQPWLNQGDWRTRLQGGERYFADLPSYRRHPLSRRAIPQEQVAWLEQLWYRRRQLAHELRDAPRCFCHNDAFRRNLMLRRSDNRAEIVAIDWAFSGEGAVGEDAAKLVVTSLVYLERPATAMRALFETVHDGYLAGLRAAGWTGDAALVRRTYATAATLFFLEHTWLALQGIHSDIPVEMAERIFGHPIGDIVDQHAALGRFVMTLTDG